MDPHDRKILAEFDLAAASSMPSARTLSQAHLSVTEEEKAAISRLVEQGYLRGSGEPDTYIRTEDGRLQLASPRDVTLYSRPGCHLCEEAKAQIAPLLKEFGARLTEVNIDEDPDLRARYDYDVPVIFLGTRKVAKHRVDIAQFRRQLRDATA